MCLLSIHLSVYNLYGHLEKTQKQLYTYFYSIVYQQDTLTIILE